MRLVNCGVNHPFRILRAPTDLAFQVVDAKRKSDNLISIISCQDGWRIAQEPATPKSPNLSERQGEAFTPIACPHQPTSDINAH